MKKKKHNNKPVPKKAKGRKKEYRKNKTKRK